MKLLFEIDKKNYDNDGKAFIRPSARAIIIKDNKIYMVHSLVYDYYKFPGGGIEKQESNIDALIRETAEETKREALVLEEEPTYIEDYITPGGEDVRLYYFIAKDNGPSNNTSEDTHPTYWVPYDEVSDMLSYPSLIKVWDNVKDKVKSYFE